MSRFSVTGCPLGRLLSNLLSNAVRYTTRGRVEFTAAWRDGPEKTLAIGVVDTGAGIEADEQESIFEPWSGVGLAN